MIPICLYQTITIYYNIVIIDLIKLYLSPFLIENNKERSVKMHHKIINRNYIDTDIMRIISSFCVVLIHIVTCVKSKTILDPNISEIINVLCRFSVPVFVMISGRYMIEKNHDIEYLIIKSLKLFVIMIFCASIYTINDIIISPTNLSAKDFINRILTSQVHLWYIYMTCCLYLFTPLLSAFVLNSTKKQVRFIIFLCFFFGSILYIPLHTDGFYILKEIIEQCKIDCTLAFVGCYLLGSYLYRFNITIAEKYIICIFGVLGFVTSIIGVCGNYLDGYIKELMISFFAPNVLSQSIMFFYIIKVINSKIGTETNTAIHRIINTIASCTFGIYLWHILVMQKIMAHINYPINTIDVILIAVCIYIICLIIMILYKILKKVGASLFNMNIVK